MATAPWPATKPPRLRTVATLTGSRRGTARGPRTTRAPVVEPGAEKRRGAPQFDDAMVEPGLLEVDDCGDFLSAHSTLADRKSPCTSCTGSSSRPASVTNRRRASRAAGGECSGAVSSHPWTRSGRATEAGSGAGNPAACGQSASALCSRDRAAPAALTSRGSLVSSRSPAISRWRPSDTPSSSTCTWPFRVGTGGDTGRPSSASQAVSRASAASRAKRSGAIDHLAIIRPDAVLTQAKALLSLKTTR